MKTIPVVIKSVSIVDRLKKYLNITYKLHNLTDKEQEVLINFIIEYYEISKNVKDPKMVNIVLFDKDTKEKLAKKMKIQKGVFDNYLSTFRRKNVIIDNNLNPSFVPPQEAFEIAFRFV